MWNGACEQHFGIAKKKALSQNLLHLFTHIEQDYRVECFRRCLREQQSFFFPNLPLLYGTGVYSQLIMPLHNQAREVIGVLNIVRSGECHRIKKEDLLQPLRLQAYVPTILHSTVG